ncbi:MAG: hypothetical protein ACJ71G_05165 [Nitrososphaeraceae archaeon]
MSQGPSIRVFQKSDSDKVKEFISDIIVNEFKFKLEFNTLDSDILEIDKIYTNLIEVAFGLQKPLLMIMIILTQNKNNKNKK